MTRNQNEERNALDRLADALVDDILSMSDEEALAEAEDDGIDPAKVSDSLRDVFNRVVTEAGKAKLASARRDAAKSGLRDFRLVQIDTAATRRRYDAMIAQNPKLTEDWTLAARKGSRQSERDIDTAIEDLVELGALDDEEDGR